MRIYFSGIGGVGIGPLAEVAQDAGYDVVGSDRSESLTTRQLADRNITVHIGQDGSSLETEHQAQSIDWFVHTAALPENHPELVKAHELGIRTSKRDELLSHIITEKNLRLIAVAGTHGKTTTSGMLVWTLQQLGVPVSYIIGTTLNWGPSGKFDPASRYFVYECDEFDRNFLQFQPHLSLITNIEHDHPDTYPTEADYFGAFSQFAEQSDFVIGWHADLKQLTFGSESWQLGNEEIVDLPLAGAHNRRNGTLVVKALEKLRLPVKPSILADFPGTNRRFEKLSGNLYTDYGHTPTEIASTLQMARELSDDVVLVYQPHQNVRQHEIRAQYTDEIFKDASEVYWLPTYQSREKTELEILTPAQLTAQLHRTNVHISNLDDTLWTLILHAQHNDKLVLCMGAGSIDGWVRSHLSNS